MALVTGPLFSLDASGKLADALVYAKWKGRPYVREWVRPANPRTLPQIAQRAYLSMLTALWQLYKNSENVVASWETLARAYNISTFNAFTQYNLKSFRNGVSYVALPTDVGDDPDWSCSDPTTAVVSGRNVTITFETNNPNGESGVPSILCLSDFAAADAENLRNIAAFVIIDVDDPYVGVVQIKNLRPGHYYAVAAAAGIRRVGSFSGAIEFDIA